MLGALILVSSSLIIPMETIARNIIKSLIVDQNIPQDTARQILQLMLEHWPDDERNILQACWKTLSQIDSKIFLFKGPRVSLQQEKIRVSRIVPLIYLIEHGYVDLALDDPAPYQFEPKSWEKLLTSKRLVCVTLNDEIHNVNPDELRDQFGLPTQRGDTLVSISYDIDPSYLHVPTALDAFLSPTFVSKPSQSRKIPRAWNWKKNDWGLPELIHPPTVSIENPEINTLGVVSSIPAELKLFSSFVPPYNQEIENVVSQILLQVRSHKDIQQFISGEHDLVSLSPREFEAFIDLLYQRRGYKTSITKATYDDGFDVIGFSDMKERNGLLIQAKHTSRTVGIRVIRELIGARIIAGEQYMNHILVICTTGRFSRPAKNVQSQFPTQISLVDGHELQRQLIEYRNIGVSDIVQIALDYLPSYHE